MESLEERIKSINVIQHEIDQVQSVLESRAADLERSKLAVDELTRNIFAMTRSKIDMVANLHDEIDRVFCPDLVSKPVPQLTLPSGMLGGEHV